MPKPAPNRGVKYDATGNQLITTEYDPDEALGATKQYRDEAQAAANAAENSEANAKQSEITVTQKAQEVIQTANQALQDINTEETSAISNIQTTGGQYVQEAKDWAVKMDDKVDEVDFSAKYWAEKASAAVQQRVLNEMIISPVPLISAALHLTDGEKLVYGSNAQYIDYMIEYKKTYPEYFTTEEEWQRQVTTNGRCAKYVLDEAAKTIRLPKIIGYIEGTVTPSELGVFTPAGLPNITGTMVSDISEGVATGALKIDTIHSGAMWQGSANVARMRNWSLDASLSNPIYGNSDTVQTDSIKVYYYIVVATGVKTDVQIDIDQVITDLNNKAARDLSNCTKPYVVETYKNGTSWYRVWSDGYCEQGGYWVGTLQNYTIEISLLKPYKTWQYHVSLNGHKDGVPNNFTLNRASNSSQLLPEKFFVVASFTNGLLGFTWTTSGYIS